MGKSAIQERKRQANLYGVSGRFPKTRKTPQKSRHRRPPPAPASTGPNQGLEQGSDYSLRTVYRDDGTILEGRHRHVLRGGVDTTLHSSDWKLGAQPPREFSKAQDPYYTAFNRPLEQSVQRPQNWRPSLYGSPLLWPDPLQLKKEEEPPSSAFIADAMFDYLIPESPTSGGPGQRRARPASSPSRGLQRPYSGGKPQRQRPDSAAPVMVGRLRPSSASSPAAARPRPGSAHPSTRRPGSGRPASGARARSARPGSAHPSSRPPLSAGRARPQSAAATSSNKRPVSASASRRPKSGTTINTAYDASDEPWADEGEFYDAFDEEALPTINRKPLRTVPSRPQSAHECCTSTFSWRAPIHGCSRCQKRLLSGAPSRPGSAAATPLSQQTLREKSSLRRPASASQLAPVLDPANPGYRLGLDPPPMLKKTLSAPKPLPLSVLNEDSNTISGLNRPLSAVTLSSPDPRTGQARPDPMRADLYRNPHASLAKTELVRVAGVAREPNRTHTMRLTGGVLRRLNTEGVLARKKAEEEEAKRVREGMFEDAVGALFHDRSFHLMNVTPLFGSLRAQALVNLPAGQAEHYKDMTFAQYTGVVLTGNAGKKLFSKKADPEQDAIIGASLPLPLWVDRAQFVRVLKALGVTAPMKVVNKAFSAFDVDIEDCMDIGEFCHTMHDLRERTDAVNNEAANPGQHHHHSPSNGGRSSSVARISRSRAGSQLMGARPQSPPTQPDVGPPKPRRFSYAHRRAALKALED